jgi:hypothetical protein
MTATDLLIVAGVPPWPPVNGGRIRAARIAEELARHFGVRIAAPAPAKPPAGLDYEELPDEEPPAKLRAFASAYPAVGRQLLGPRRRGALAAVVARRRPRVVVFAHSYLAAVVPPSAVPFAVDFTDVEVRRMASLARRGAPRKRLAWGLEWAKARRWEPAVARRAVVAVGQTPDDTAVLASWGAHAVCVPHGADPVEASPSPPAGPVTYVGSMGYGPNLDGARFLLEHVWPRVRARDTDIRLRIVGWEAEQRLDRNGARDGVEVVSDAPDLRPFYREAAFMVAPVREGGGAQVKVAEALGSGRLVVATPFSRRSAPANAAETVVVAQGADRFAEAVVALWRDLDDRRARERAFQRRIVPSWEQTTGPLVVELKRVLRAR